MVTATNDIKFIANKLDSTNFKNTSMSSITTVTSKTATTTTTLTDQNATTTTPIKKRLESMTDEEIIQRNLKELMDKKNRVSFVKKIYKKFTLILKIIEK